MNGPFENKVPEDILLSNDQAALCYWLCMLVVEWCKEGVLLSILQGCSNISQMKKAVLSDLLILAFDYIKH